MRRGLIFLSVLLLLGAVLTFLVVRRAGEPVTVRILFTGDDFGYLDPCGCAGTNAGGFARRALYIKEQEGTADIVLKIDSGDFSGTTSREGAYDTACLVEGFHRLGYDVVTLGERDLFQGQVFVRQMMETLGAPFVSANVVDRDTGQLVGVPVRWFRAGGWMVGGHRLGGIRIAVTGACLDNFAADLLERGGPPMRVLPPRQELERQVAAARGRADLVVVVAHLGWDGAVDLAQSVPGIDVIVSGHRSRSVEKPEQVNGVLIVHPADRGRTVGDLTAVVKPRGGIEEWSGSSETLKVELPEDPVEADFVAECRSRHPATSPTPSPTAAEPTAPEEPGAEPASGPSGGPAYYLGADACRSCHRAIYDDWKSTPHARAFATLEEKGKEEDPACTRCHTTGYGRGNGFRTLAFTPEMVNVQCEECHGPGSHHVDRLTGAGTGTLVPGEIASGNGLYVCVRCHNREQDPQFDYQNELRAGSHRPAAGDGARQ